MYRDIHYDLRVRTQCDCWLNPILAHG